MKSLFSLVTTLWIAWGVVLSFALFLHPANLDRLNDKFYQEARALHEAAPEMKGAPDEITSKGISIYTRDPLDLGLVAIPPNELRMAAQEYVVDTTQIPPEIGGASKIPELKLRQPEEFDVPNPNPIRVALLAEAQDKRVANMWRSTVKKRSKSRKLRRKKRRRNLRRVARRSNLGRRVTSRPKRRRKATRRSIPKRYREKTTPKGYTFELKKALQIATR